MGVSKRDALKIAAVLGPFPFLFAYLLGLAFPAPSFLLPERRYVAVGRDAGAEGLKAARGRAREAYAVLPDRLLPLPSPLAAPAAFERAASLLPDEPVLNALLRELEAGIPPFRRARLVTDFWPGTEELEVLRRAATGAGLPLALEVRAKTPAIPILSLSFKRSSLEERLSFELLLAERAKKATSIEVVALKGDRGSTGRLVLWQGKGTELPDDRVLRLSTDRKGLSGIEFQAELEGQRLKRSLGMGTELDEDPRVLVISEKPEQKSFIESLYPAKRVDRGTAGSENLQSYELVVIDGLPLKSIDGPLLRGMTEVAERRTGSLFFAADTPDFGTKGDNPALEELLPVSLLPRSLKDLPDLALLIMIDTSGSMFGDKLSLAKVTGLELLRSLKPTDLVGMLLFSDERQWAYDFQINKAIAAAPTLEPVSAGGGTDLAPALAEGLERLGKQGLKDKHLVIVSDGVTKPADFQALAERARRLGITISTMGVGEDLNRPLLERLALQAGGRFYTVGSVDEIPALLFEDRKSAARPPFAQGSIPILALSGERVATIGGMAQYAAANPATVLFTNDLGDPLFASREYGNRAVMLFASDLYGTYTADFFGRAATAGALKDRLDLLFSERPLEVSLCETSRGITVVIRSDSLASPSLLLSRAGAENVEADMNRSGPNVWSARVVLPEHGSWHTALLDRGSSVAGFPLVLNGGLSGIETDSAQAAAHWRPLGFRRIRLDLVWLALFFAASLGTTIILRFKR